MRSTTLFSKTGSSRAGIEDSSPRVAIPQSSTEQYKRKNPDTLKNQSYGELSISNSKLGMASNIKQRRTRTTFTNSQMKELLDAFEKHFYIDKVTRADLAQRTNLTETQIKIWFYNRRMKKRNSIKKSNSTDAVQHPMNDSLDYSVMNQSISELSNYSPQSHQMHEIIQPLIHQLHMQMPHAYCHTVPLHQIQNSAPAYHPSYPLTSWNPTLSYNLANSLSSSVASQFHRSFNEESSSDYPTTSSTTNSLPSPILSEYHHSFIREECSPDHFICPQTSNTTVDVSNSENGNDTIETIESMPRRITIANNNLYSPWSYTCSQPLQPISFSDIQSSSGNQMQYITSGLSMHHNYSPSSMQQNVPTLSTLSEVRNIPQQYSRWY